MHALIKMRFAIDDRSELEEMVKLEKKIMKYITAK